MIAFGVGTLCFLLHMWGVGGDSWLFHPINLAIHEAGHVVFAPLGFFMGMLGGSLFQCLIPLVCVIYFFRRREAMGAAAAGMWFGENFLDVAIYIADARIMALQMVGGGTIHDWNWLLSRTGLLDQCLTLAWLAHALGWIIMLISAGLYAMFCASHTGLRDYFLKKGSPSQAHHRTRK